MPGNAVAATAELLTPTSSTSWQPRQVSIAKLTRRAVDAGVPAILSGLNRYPFQAGGARRLACAVVKQPAGPWEGLAGAPKGGANRASRRQPSCLAARRRERRRAHLEHRQVHGCLGTPRPTLLSLLAPAIISRWVKSAATRGSMPLALPTSSDRRRTWLRRPCRPVCRASSRSTGFTIASASPRAGEQQADHSG